MSSEIQLRFRHTSGDIGPISFPESASIQQIRETILLQWPKDGPISKEAPAQVSEIKFIVSGKFVDNNKTLADYKKDMGELDSIVTMHLIVRPQQAVVKPPPPGTVPPEKPEAKGCACVII
mmetsp:Transcript_32126/g.58470  ORF Transcript_32126/g.58470 Transcript_32126/m.58470 type:complete len:121 (-) Transcript_32126:277-639(-)|eukprot:CAMPEP_0175062792 /NCGR_PEP_ID=MMETSP0052_2-20121109/14372_1 /TAXON_ID=51329 ORGANISM="Polytomella parva, Strain SAG 63-3" /NCGR_SAMPLE_ID=MMETSP0052_2 /ASSEMBLY_ACC=CAM_ASM_000194 /LENGTH=120 /DNA_ID=CAMNT_0016328867 /DNA_START=18 /DNA_END=380 /DNA_ORIENTATION=+